MDSPHFAIAADRRETIRLNGAAAAADTKVKLNKNRDSAAVFLTPHSLDLLHPSQPRSSQLHMTNK